MEKQRGSARECGTITEEPTLGQEPYVRHCMFYFGRGMLVFRSQAGGPREQLSAVQPRTSMTSMLSNADHNCILCITSLI